MSRTVHYYAIEDLKSAKDSTFLLLCADDDADGQADPDVLEWARERSEDVVDSFAQARYESVVPWDTDANNDEISDDVPGIIVHCAINIAIYILASRPSGSAITDDIRTNYEDAIALLRDIAAGNIELGTDPATDESTLQILDNSEDLDDLGSPFMGLEQTKTF